MSRIKIKQQAGFSLIELALVLMIVGLLTAGTLSVLSSQREQVSYADSNQALAQTKQAVLSFLVVNGFLPCPDTTGDGLENRTNQACEAVSGEVPYRDIGLRLADVRDGFGNRLRYVINAEATSLAALQDSAYSASFFNTGDESNPAPVFDLNTPPTASDSGTGNYAVCGSGGATCDGASQKQMEGMPIVLVSFNQRGQEMCQDRPVQEQENCDGDAFFWQGGYAPLSDQDGFFDDEIVGVSAYEIKSHYMKNHPGAL
ncbi:type II secretion system protein [Thiomicrospira sp. XS5]|uniref:type II secretion system protein n=1 Tax=Thiomicrospira sp. XS5 TaxID=1775636 RepID=UPI000A9617F5|nr:type II secretion system protein [Thiomicrospira sp. XS5]